jgi:outer membrane protein TolC
MLAMSRYEQQSIDSRRQMIKRMGYPMLGVGVNYSLIGRNEMSISAMNGKDMIMPMLTLSLPIYRKKYKAMRNEANYLKEASVQVYNASLNTLQNDYYEAVQQYEDAVRRVKLYQNQAQLAQSSLDIMIQRYAGSGASLSDVLRIRQQTLDFESRKVEAVAELNSAVVWLERIVNK